MRPDWDGAAAELRDHRSPRQHQLGFRAGYPPATPPATAALSRVGHDRLSAARALADPPHLPAAIRSSIAETIGTAGRSVGRPPSMHRLRFSRAALARRYPMSTPGLDVFDKTVQTTNIWLDEIMAVM